MSATNNGPTLNPEYNATLQDWGRAGRACEPECEDCGRDLTGQHVRERTVGWFCVACDDKRQAAPAPWLEPRERWGNG